MNRHALLIGINHYPHLAASHQLHGCENDLRLLRDLLVGRFGFTPKHVTTLLNGEASRHGILSALDRLAGVRAFAGQSPVREGDVVVIAYSGHGSRTADIDGDETDLFDSTLVPSDSDRPAPDGQGGENLDILDDVLFNYFEEVRRITGRKGHLSLWFDCCRSGTIARDIEGGTVREIPPDARHAARDGMERGEPPERGGSGWRRLEDGYVLLAGCADDEKSKEVRHPATQDHYGAMTLAFVEEISRRSGRVTYHDVFEAGRKAVTLQFPTQHPQLEGDWDTLLFGSERVDAPPFVEVLARHDDHNVTLATGAVLGVNAGSVFAIYPPELDSEPAGTVTVTRGRNLESDAVSDSTLPPELRAGWRATEVRRPASGAALVVAVEGAGPELEQLRDRIRASDRLRLARNEPAQVIAVHHPARTDADLDRAAAEGHPVFAPELGAFEEAAWVITGRDFGMLPIPVHPDSDTDALELTYRNLETWARYLEFQARRAPGADPLQPLVSAQFGAADVPRPGVLPLPVHTRSGLPLVRVGSRARLVLTNRFDEPVYFYVFSLDAVGAITPVFPFNRRTREPVQREVPVVIDFDTALPAAFPSPLEGGRESLKVFVTLTPVSFDGAGQDGARGGTEHPALAGLAHGARGGGDPVFLPVQSERITPDTWTTVDVQYWIAR